MSRTAEFGSEVTGPQALGFYFFPQRFEEFRDFWFLTS